MIYTFYSFKGGVGRSMALAAVAYVFAQRGLKVLTIDFDLEAPGLERYFVPSRQAAQARTAPGLIDLLEAYKAAMTSEAEFEKGRFRNWWDFVIEAVPNAKGGGYVDLMTAGAREPEARLQAYASAVRSFDWMDFFHNWHGEQFFVWLRQQLLGQGDTPARGYDVVLVDSRTGLTEMGGVCAYQLADCAVMLCAANQQNIDGTLQVARDFQSDAVKALRRGRELELLVLPARLEPDNLRREEFLREFEAAFPYPQFLPKALREAGQDYRTLALPYVREFAVIERLVGDDDPELGPPSAAAEATFARLADALTLIAHDGRLTEQKDSALATLSPSMARFGTPTVANAPQIADPTRRSSGFDLLLDLSALQDREQSAAIAQSLKAAGLHAWIDHEQIQASELVSDAIRTAVAQSEAVAVFVGQERISEWTARLVGWAREAGKPILPLVDGTAAPGESRIALGALGLADVLHLALDPRQPDEFAGQIKTALGVMRRATAAPSAQIVARDPYPGERAFTEDDADFFFGREREVDDLLMLTRAAGVAVVVGPAGVGKTSLLCAGLMHRLRKAPDPPRLHYVDLAAGAGSPPRREADSPREDGSPALETWLLLDGIDAFPDGGGEPAMAARIEEVTNWLAWAEGPDTRVVLAMRDTLPDPLRHAAFERWRLPMPGSDGADVPGSKLSLVFNLAPMTAAGLQAAIEKPAARVGHVLDPGLPQLLIDQAGGAYGAIAQIARVLPRLWAERNRGWLTLRAHDAAGGVRGCFEASFQAWFAGLEGERKRAAGWLVHALSHLDAGAQLATEPAPWAPLATMPVLEQADPLWLREQMAARGLIELWRAAAELAGTPSGGDVWVSLLFGTPKAYGAPFDTPLQPDFMLWRRRFASYVSSWESAGRARAAVVAGPLLAEAEQYREEHGEHLTEAERTLIDVSLGVAYETSERERSLAAEKLAAKALRKAKDEAEHERDVALAAKREAEGQRARARRAMRWSLGLAILCLTAFVAALWLNQNLNTEKRRAGLAATGGFVSAYASTDPTAAALTAVELLQDPATPANAQWRHGSVLDAYLTLAELRGHQSGVIHAAFSPDGQTLLTASNDGAVRLWSQEGKPLAELRGHQEPLTHAAFSPDGQTLLTASADSTARLWSREGKPLAELHGHQGWVWHTTFSPDGQTVLTASNDNTARLWSREGKPLAELRGHRGPVTHAAFSPDGQTLLTASSDSTARLWSREGKPLAELHGHQGWVKHAAFSPDGLTLLTASFDGTARLWSRGGKTLAELRGHQQVVWHAAFSPDGQTLLTASGDGTARLWSREGKPLAELRGHQGPVTHAAFSPDGQTVLTASDDYTARLWSQEGKPLAELRGHRGPVTHAAFNPDGQTLLTTSSDGNARLWSQTSKPLVELRRHQDSVTHAAFSPDGQTVLTTSADKTARLWSREGKPLAELQEHQYVVTHAVFSPDGQTLLTTSVDGTARLWDREGKPLAACRTFLAIGDNPSAGL